MTSNIDVVPGPDQGIGWLMAMACFGINFVMAGLARTAGVLYVALIDLYGVSREAASSPFTIRVCVRNMIGPLIGLLGVKYGIRGVTTIGAAVAGVGSILCYFAPNVMWITAFWGIIHGLGFGMSTVLHMMVINQYFDKYKASALGLGYSGDCFGTFAFPVIMECLLTTYGVKGTFLILGGIVLNVVPMALLLQKPPWLRKNAGANFTRNIVQQNTCNNEINNSTSDLGFDNKSFQNFDEDLSIYDVSMSNNYEGGNIQNVNDEPPAYQETLRKSPMFNKCIFDLSPHSGSLRCKSRTSEFSDIFRENMERHGSLPPVFEKESPDTVQKNKEKNIISSETEASQDTETPKDTEASKECNNPDSVPPAVQRPPSVLQRTSSIVSQVVHRMRTASFASQVTQEGFIATIQPEQLEEPLPAELSEIVCDHNECKIISLNSSIPEKSQSFQNSITDFNHAQLAIADSKTSTTPICQFHQGNFKKQSMWQTLIKTNAKPIFILISLSMAVYAYLFVGVLTIIIDYAVDNGVSNERGKYLIIGFSVADLFGRLSFGQILDRRLIKLKNYLGSTMVLMGTFVAVLPLNSSFNFMLVCMCLYGLVQGGLAIVFPILVNEYMERNEESVAMGCLNFYGGLLMLSLAPMIGFFRDNTGSYNGVFHILGGMVLVIGLVWLFEPLIIKFQRKQMLKKLNPTILINI